MKWQKDIKFHTSQRIGIWKAGFDPSYIKGRPNDKHFIITCWCQSYQYFEGMDNDIRYMFLFSTSLKLKTQQTFLNILSSLTGNSPTSVIFVGIHIARYLYANNIQLPHIDYFLNAMSHFKNKYINSRVIFIVGGKDGKWAMQNLMNVTDTFFLHGTGYEDLCSLSLCNHTIISYGTFGWWAGFLTGGQVVFYHNILSERANFYPPYWIPLG